MSIPENVTKVEIRYVPGELINEVTPKAMLGLREGYLPVDKLEVQDTPGIETVKRAANHPKNLETIYNAYQLIDDTSDERCAQLRIRSMTYGDAIVVDGVGYYVCADGFLVEDATGQLVPVKNVRA